jgi:NTP pyrophosphatase (non-canonical NTP hydrolase)
MKESVALEMIAKELKRATDKHGRMRGLHEAYAVILEELDELWDEIKHQRIDYRKVQKEAIQVGAMAARLLGDIFQDPLPPPEEE